MAHWCERDGFTGNRKSSHWLWTAVISYSACTVKRLGHYWNNPALSFIFIMTEKITQLAEAGLLSLACMHVSESGSLTVCARVCVCVCATWRTFLWLHYREKMTPWPALGLFKRESTRHTYAHQQTYSWKHTRTQQNATSLMHFSEQGKPGLGASAVLFSPCAAVSTLAHSLPLNKCTTQPVLPSCRQVVSRFRPEGCLAYHLMLF